MSTGIVCNNLQKAKMVSVPLSILSFIGGNWQKKKSPITGRRSAGGHHHCLSCMFLYWIHHHS
ncbi:unnamed protein product, partial [Bubo scandiacus]